MDQNANDLLAQLQERLRQESLVKGIEDLNVGDIIYYDMDRADGIVPNSGYDTTTPLHQTGRRNNTSFAKQIIQPSSITTAGLTVLTPGN